MKKTPPKNYVYYSGNDIVPALFNSETKFKNCPAFCFYHHAFMTEQQMKTKNCLSRQCKRLRKIHSHYLWIYKDYKKVLKKSGEKMMDLDIRNKAIDINRNKSFKLSMTKHQPNVRKALMKVVVTFLKTMGYNKDIAKLNTENSFFFFYADGHVSSTDNSDHFNKSSLKNISIEEVFSIKEPITY